MTRDHHFLDEKFEEMGHMVAQLNHINGNVETIGLASSEVKNVGTVGLGRYMDVTVATVGLMYFVMEKLEVIGLWCSIVVFKVIVLEFFGSTTSLCMSSTKPMGWSSTSWTSSW